MQTEEFVANKPMDFNLVPLKGNKAQRLTKKQDERRELA